ncbi:Zinc cluster transcription factor CZF1 [Colletotrichum siamense]|nr:Zinc cluster transcription factor CZF1 [Colletotrichum siamense]
MSDKTVTNDVAVATGRLGRGRPITRQRRGCLTCRRRKKKCHEQYPFCSHCLRLNLVCRWEEPREVTVGTESFKSTSSVGSANSILSSGPHLVDINRLGVYALPKHGPSPCGGAGEDDLISSRRMMLRYYTTSLVFMLTNNLHNNCFLSVLLPMAFECPSLMYALAASSSAHLALQDDIFQVRALQHRGNAMAELKSSITKGSLTREMRLATTLVLCSMESISSGIDDWIHHLSGAAACLNECNNMDTASSIDGQALIGDDIKALSQTYEGRWLLRNFAYHDIIMSVSLNCKPHLAGDYWLSSEDYDVADPYFGHAAEIIHLIGETSHLNQDFSMASQEATLSSNTLSGVSDATALTAGLCCKARRLETKLQDWKCPSRSQDASLIILADAYRHAALIYLYRVLRKHITSHPESLESNLSESVTAICKISREIPKGCYAETSMIFPLFMAGGEATSQVEIVTIREGFASLNHRRRFRNVDACVSVLEEVWKCTGAGSGRFKMDWMDIARTRGWKLALF